MATGQVLFQRFYFSKSFVKHDAEVGQTLQFFCSSCHFFRSLDFEQVRQFGLLHSQQFANFAKLIFTISNKCIFYSFV